MKGKVVLITGATSGIGEEAAAALAGMGATVVITSRDDARGKTVLDEIARSSGGGNVELLHCDLASLDSVRAACREFKARYDRLDVLINNAGVWDFHRRRSRDGIENILATNFLAPFLMTNLLLDTLKRSRPSRIINVSSRLHGGRINFDDIEFKGSFPGMKAYRQSKLALILFTRLLAKRLAGTGVTVNCLHPGLVATGLARDASPTLRFFFRMFGKSPRKGAETIIYLASSPEAGKITGEFFGRMKVARASKESHDMKMAERLWEVGERYTGSIFRDF